MSSAPFPWASARPFERLCFLHESVDDAIIHGVKLVARCDGAAGDWTVLPGSHKPVNIITGEVGDGMRDVGGNEGDFIMQLVNEIAVCVREVAAERRSEMREAVLALRENLASERAAHHATRQRLELCELRESGGGGGVSRVINSPLWTDAKAIAAYAEFQGCFEEVVFVLFDLPGFDAADAVQRASRAVLGAATAYYEEAYRAERARLQALPDMRDAGAVSRVMRSEFCLIATDAHVAACVRRCVAELPSELGARFAVSRHSKWVGIWLCVQCWLRLNLEDPVDATLSGRERFDPARHRKCGTVPDDGECVMVIPPFTVAGRLVVPGVVCA